MNIKVSIAMATYNGEKYLREQLNSIAAQTIRPYEIIVCDDCSTDRTVEILKKFSCNSSLNIQIIENKKNLGFTRNFEKAISLCSGDLIFLSDQDDTWDREKVKVILDHMSKNKKKHVFINDALYTDKDLQSEGKTVLERVIDVVGQRNGYDAHIAGAATAITKEFRDFIIPFPDNCPGHDAYIHRFAKLLDIKIVIPDVLQTWRIHGENNSSNTEMSQAKGLSNLSLYRKYKNEDVSKNYLQKCNEYKSMYELITKRKYFLSLIVTEEKIRKVTATILEIIDAHENRAKLFSLNWINRKKLILVMLKNGQYRYFQGLKSVIKDILR